MSEYIELQEAFQQILDGVTTDMKRIGERVQKEATAIEAVLLDYLATEPPPSYEKLNDWCKRYPQYAKELSELEVGRAMLETLAPDKRNEL